MLASDWRAQLRFNWRFRNLLNNYQKQLFAVPVWKKIHVFCRICLLKQQIIVTSVWFFNFIIVILQRWLLKIIHIFISFIHKSFYFFILWNRMTIALNESFKIWIFFLHTFRSVQDKTKIKVKIKNACCECFNKFYNSMKVIFELEYSFFS